jgi:hypothetical protein
MANSVPFPPSIKVSTRSYNPGIYPSTDFKSLDGTRTHIRYGNKRVDATLQLGFSNVSDSDAALILSNYESVNSDWDYVSFDNSKITDGIASNSLKTFLNESGTSLRWRYSSPPTVTSVFPGISNVNCNFVACLDS